MWNWPPHLVRSGIIDLRVSDGRTLKAASVNGYYQSKVAYTYTNDVATSATYVYGFVLEDADIYPSNYTGRYRTLPLRCLSTNTAG